MATTTEGDTAMNRQSTTAGGEVLSFFTWDDERLFPGYHHPHQRWNGYACPSFTWDIVRDIADHIDTETGSSCQVGYDDATRTAWEYDIDDDYREDVLRYDDATVGTLYAVGSWGWVWSEVLPDTDSATLATLYAVHDLSATGDGDRLVVAYFYDEAPAREWATKNAGSRRLAVYPMQVIA